jgi:hypothetical protein
MPVNPRLFCVSLAQLYFVLNSTEETPNRLQQMFVREVTQCVQA